MYLLSPETLETLLQEAGEIDAYKVRRVALRFATSLLIKAHHGGDPYRAPKHQPREKEMSFLLTQVLIFPHPLLDSNFIDVLFRFYLSAFQPFFLRPPSPALAASALALS